MQVGHYDLQIQEKEGFRLIAPTSYWLASEDEIKEHTGGCGPGKFGDHLVPDTAYGESIFLACQIHDWMYFVGLSLEDKRMADLCFLINMVLIVDDGDWLDDARLYRCMTYYIAVARAGKSAFGKECT
jgi:hypothetical protein